MKAIFFFFSLVTTLVADLKIKDPAEITYDWLVQSKDSDASEYIPYFKEIFEKLKVKAFLQFGVGYSTKYFADHSKKLISIEFVTPGCGPARFREFLKMYESVSNWIGIGYFSGYQGDTSWAYFKYLGSEHVYKASGYQSTQRKTYADIDPTYVNEMSSFLTNLCKLNQFEVAFIDPVIFIRGDIVRLLFGKVPVILAYDAWSRISRAYVDVYNYAKLEAPPEYDEIPLRGPHTTIAWILRDAKYKELADVLRNL